MADDDGDRGGGDRDTDGGRTRARGEGPARTSPLWRCNWAKFAVLAGRVMAICASSSSRSWLMGTAAPTVTPALVTALVSSCGTRLMSTHTLGCCRASTGE